MIIADKKVTQAEADRMMVPLEQDLIALFKLQEEAVIKLTNRAITRGWRPEKLIREIELLFEDKETTVLERAKSTLEDFKVMKVKRIKENDTA